MSHWKNPENWNLEPGRFLYTGFEAQFTMVTKSHQTVKLAVWDFELFKIREIFSMFALRCLLILKCFCWCCGIYILEDLGILLVGRKDWFKDCNHSVLKPVRYSDLSKFLAKRTFYAWWIQMTLPRFQILNFKGIYCFHEETTTNSASHQKLKNCKKHLIFEDYLWRLWLG